MEGDRAPEEAGPHLHREMAVVVRVPDPDVAAIFDHAGIGGGLHTNGFEGAERGFDLFATFYFERDRYGVRGVDDGEHEALTNIERLRGGIENSGQQIGNAAGDRLLNVLGIPFDEVLLVEDGFLRAVVKPERGIHLTAALHGLLIKLVGAALGAVESRLEMVADMEEQVECANCFRRGGDFFAVALGLEVQDRGAGWKDPPVNVIGQGLSLGKAEARPGGGQRWGLLRKNWRGGKKAQKKRWERRFHLHRQDSDSLKEFDA